MSSVEKIKIESNGLIRSFDRGKKTYKFPVIALLSSGSRATLIKIRSPGMPLFSSVRHRLRASHEYFVQPPCMWLIVREITAHLKSRIHDKCEYGLS